MISPMELIVTNSIIISITLRIVSCIILLIFLIPLQIKESQVKNGLKILRYQLLAGGLIIFLINIFSLAFLFLAMEIPQRPINAFLQIGNAVAFLSLSIIAGSIYKNQYTDEAKDYHEKIDKLEKLNRRNK